MNHLTITPTLIGFLAMLALAGTGLDAQAAESGTADPDAPAGVIELDETVISGNQELPKILYILPWRDPQGLPQIELRADFTEVEVFRRLYPPAYRRELEYFDTLDSLNNEE